MSQFPIHTLETAPAASRPGLDAARERYGFLPNLLGEMAESPALLSAYGAVQEQFTDHSSFTAAEQQLVLLTVSYLHECRYCVAAHSRLARAAKLALEHIQALRGGRPLADPRLEALRVFTVAMVRDRGWVDQQRMEAFFAHGFTPASVLDVIVGIAYKTMSNYTNHVAETPLDEAFAPLAWEPPADEPVQPLGREHERIER